MSLYIFESIGNVLGIDVYSSKMTSVTVIFTQGYLGAIGAFLKGADTLKTEQYSWQVLCYCTVQLAGHLNQLSRYYVFYRLTDGYCVHFTTTSTMLYNTHLMVSPHNSLLVLCSR